MTFSLSTAAIPTAPAGRRASGTVISVVVAASFVPFLLPLLEGEPSAGPLYQAAEVLGLVALLAMWWQMILGMRQITSLLNVDGQSAIRLHTWLGIFGALAILLHPLVWRVAEGQDWSFLWQIEFEFVEARYVSLGRIAVLLFLIVWISSTLTRYALRYRWWRNLHYLTYPMTILVFVHSFGATGLLDEYVLLNAYWWVLAVLLAAAIVYRLVAPQLTGQARLAVHAVIDGVAVVRIDRPAVREPVRPGQYFSVRIRRWGRSHPYSVIQQDTGGALWLAVAGVGRHSRAMAETPDGTTVYLDGPHGSFLDRAETQTPRVYIAGGIGITPFVWDLRTSDVQDTTLLHLVRRREALAFADVFAQRLGTRYQPVVSSESGRLAAASIDASLRRSATFWVCGSPAFVEQWRTQLRRAGVARRRIRTEQLE